MDYSMRDAVVARREIIRDAVEAVREPGTAPPGFRRGDNGSVPAAFSSSTEGVGGVEVYQAFTELGDATQTGLVTGGY